MTTTGPTTAPTAAAPPQGRFARLVEDARRRPGTVLAWVLGAHLVLWTLVPMIVCANLQLDLVEDLALGREWQFGYWKHPPLPWWLADALYRATGDIRSVYLLGPLCAVLAIYVVWRLAREVVDPLPALIAALTLEGLHYFNFSVVKFAHDQMQLPFWALAGWFTWRAVMRGRLYDWALAGAFVALCFWSKYAALALGVTLALVLIADPTARRAWRTPGPYVMAAVFLVVMAPHLRWLVESGFAPLHYVDERAGIATHWYQYPWFPIRWTGSQVIALLPALALLGLAGAGFARRIPREAPLPGPAEFSRRYVTALALGPFAVTTIVAAVLGRLPIAMWGYPLWCFAPLAVVMWFPPSGDPRRLAWFGRGFAMLFAGWIVIYAGAEALEPLLRDRPKATQFPGRLLADTVTQAWRARTGQPLAYVGGAAVGTGPGEFAANNIAVYSADRPHVIVHGNPALSPWIDTADVTRRGAVFAWEQPPGAPDLPENLRVNFPGAEPQPPLTLPRHTLRPRSPAVIHWAILPPRP